MKVLHLITTIERGGAENQLAVLVQEQIQHGYEVGICFLKGIPEMQKQFESFGAYVDGTIANQNPLIQLIRLFYRTKKKINVLHCHLPRSEFIGALVSVGKPKFSLVITRHNAEPFFPKAPRFLSRIMGSWVSRRADGAIAISHAVRDFNIRTLESDPNAFFEVIYYGFERFEKDKVEIGLENEKSAKLIIGTIGRLVEQKNIDFLIRSFSTFREKSNIESELWIIGSGPLLSKLIATANGTKSASHIKFIPRNPEVRRLLNELDIFVLASKYEGFGLVLLEAMQAGKPIIGADNTAISEVLAQGGGLLFPTEDSDALIKYFELLADENIREQVALSGQMRLQDFSPDKMFFETHSHYLKVLKK